jgi:peptidoglycan hydrolase-like protein with peptidoglycan-binding domain
MHRVLPYILLIIAPYTVMAQVDTATTTAVATTADSTSTPAIQTLEDRPYIYLSGPHCLTFPRTLQVGSKGSDVRTLQYELYQLGFLRTTDLRGRYDATTSIAVMQLQSAYNIIPNPTGIVGRVTRNFFRLMCPVVIPRATSTPVQNATTSNSTSITSGYSTSYSTSTRIKTADDSIFHFFSSAPPSIQNVKVYIPTGNCIGNKTYESKYLDAVLGSDTCTRLLNPSDIQRF